MIQDGTLAFLGGLVSFFSPCFLPLVPGYIALISGISYEDMREGKTLSLARWQALFWTCLFCAGMLVVFVLMGFLATRVRFLVPLPWITTVAGIFFMLMGLWFLSNTSPMWVQATWLPRWPQMAKSGSYERSLLCFVTGGIFAVSWIPCTGPILALILLRVAQNDSSGILMMVLYASGRSLPLMVFSLFLPQLAFLLRGNLWGKSLQVVMAGLLLLFGALMITGYGQSFLASLALSFWPSLWFKGAAF